MPDLMNSVKVRTLVVTIAVIALVSFFNFFVSLNRNVDHQREFLEYSANLLAENQASAVAKVLWDLDYDAINPLIQGLKEDPNYLSIVFLDESDSEIASHRNVSMKDASDFYAVEKPIYYNVNGIDRYVGKLTYAVTYEKINDYYDEELKFAFFAMVLIVVLLSLSTHFIMGFFITQPLEEITKTLTKISLGQANVEIPDYKHTREIGSLAKAAKIFKNNAQSMIELERERKKSAEESNKLKDAFMAKMSHEIRTPLHGILGFSKLLKEKRTLEDLESDASTIESLANNMLLLVNDILDFSRIESEEVTLSIEPEQLQDAIEPIAAAAQPLAQKNNNRIFIHIDPNIPLNMSFDKLRLEQVLLNLISNACKFTENGRIDFTVSLEKMVAKKAFIRFSIKDNGIGISKEFQDKIFQSFTQEDETVAKNYGGTGLGTAISYKLVDLMGGLLELESEKGVGSEFFFTVAFNVNNFKTTFSEFKQDFDIVLFSENEADRHYFEGLFEAWGVRKFTISGAHDLNVDNDGRDKIFILNDLDEERTQFVLDETRSIVTKRLITIGHNYSTDKAVRCLSLPVSPYTLYGTIRTILQESSMTESTTDVAEKMEKVKEPVVVEKGVHILVVDDDFANRKLVERFLQKMGYTTELAEDGMDAVEKAKENHYDVILMDMMMPKMDGLEASRVIRQFDSVHADVPIIALTANAYESDIQRCYDAGMNAFLSKPFSFDDLENILQTIENS